MVHHKIDYVLSERKRRGLLEFINWYNTKYDMKAICQIHSVIYQSREKHVGNADAAPEMVGSYGAPQD